VPGAAEAKAARREVRVRIVNCIVAVGGGFGMGVEDW
jgi:hypothetical protein